MLPSNRRYDGRPAALGVVQSEGGLACCLGDAQRHELTFLAYALVVYLLAGICPGGYAVRKPGDQPPQCGGVCGQRRADDHCRAGERL